MENEANPDCPGPVYVCQGKIWWYKGELCYSKKMVRRVRGFCRCLDCERTVDFFDEHLNDTENYPDISDTEDGKYYVLGYIPPTPGMDHCGEYYNDYDFYFRPLKEKEENEQQ